MAAVGSSTLDVYNPVFYAQEALVWLQNSLGIANTVHRGFEQERAQGLGDTISIRRPQSFTAASAPATAAGLETESVSITLDQWKEVKFALTDKELAYTGDRIITEHIAPAAYALADDIDQALWALYAKVGARKTWGTGSAATELAAIRKSLFDAKVPMNMGNLFFGCGSTQESEMLADAIFTQYDGAGQVGVDAQISGRLGKKFGMDLFAAQNCPAHTGSVTTDAAGTIDNGAGYAAGTTVLHIDALTDTNVYSAGDTLTVGNYSYAIVSSGTVATNEVDITIAGEGLREAVSDGAAVTFDVTSESEVGMAYHRNAFALAMAPLPEIGNELGARVAVVQDPQTGLAIRSRLYYVGNSSQVHVALDTLYGVQVLDERLAVRVENP
jgi:hypothetical protein